MDKKILFGYCILPNFTPKRHIHIEMLPKRNMAPPSATDLAQPLK